MNFKFLTFISFGTFFGIGQIELANSCSQSGTFAPDSCHPPSAVGKARRRERLSGVHPLALPRRGHDFEKDKTRPQRRHGRRICAHDRHEPHHAAQCAEHPSLLADGGQTGGGGVPPRGRERFWQHHDRGKRGVGCRGEVPVHGGRDSGRHSGGGFCAAIAQPAV